MSLPERLLALQNECRGWVSLAAVQLFPSLGLIPGDHLQQQRGARSPDDQWASVWSPMWKKNGPRLSASEELSLPFSPFPLSEDFWRNTKGVHLLCSSREGSALAFVLVVVFPAGLGDETHLLESRKVVKEGAQCRVGGWGEDTWDLRRGGGPLWNWIFNRAKGIWWV